MKKLIAVLAAVLFSSPLMASQEEIDRASFTITNDTTKLITGARFFCGVTVSSPTQGGVVTIYDSSNTANNVVMIVNTNTIYDYGRYSYHVSSGLTYSVTGMGAGGVTIWYQR